jgi:hypothetical protein
MEGELRAGLDKQGLLVYESALMAQGLTSVALLAAASDETLRALGVKPFHVQKLRRVVPAAAPRVAERPTEVPSDLSSAALPILFSLTAPPVVAAAPSPAPASTSPLAQGGQGKRPAVKNAKRSLFLPPDDLAAENAAASGPRPQPAMASPPPLTSSPPATGPGQLAPVTPALLPVTAMEREACAGCGHGNLPHFAFCGMCGKKREPVLPVCHACGGQNLPGYRFCNSCGTPKAAAAAAAAVVPLLAVDNRAKETADRIAALERQQEEEAAAEKRRKKEAKEAARRAKQAAREEEEKRAEEERRAAAAKKAKEAKKKAEEAKRKAEEAKKKADEEAAARKKKEEEAAKKKRDELAAAAAAKKKEEDDAKRRKAETAQVATWGNAAKLASVREKPAVPIVAPSSPAPVVVAAKPKAATAVVTVAKAAAPAPAGEMTREAAMNLLVERRARERFHKQQAREQRAKKAEARAAPWLVVLARCAHSPNAATQCRVCETAKEREARLASRVARAEAQAKAVNKQLMRTREREQQAVLDAQGKSCMLFFPLFLTFSARVSFGVAAHGSGVLARHLQSLAPKGLLHPSE